ncbi:MAG: hypothetical protein LBP80_02830 [Treponema sp.]|nr:hypothetical protein [Treponema sp.]
MLKAVLLTPALLCVFSLLVSCATRPPAVEPGPGGEFAVLDGGGLAYFAVDIPGARPILDLAQFEGIRGAQAAEILDLTYTAVGAVYAGEDGEDAPAGPARKEADAPAARRYLIAAQGKYPAGRAGFAFTFSREWKKLKSPAGKPYWYSRREDLAVVLEARSALVSNADPHPRSAAVEIPGSFPRFRDNAVLAGWLNSPSVPLNRFIAQLDIPIQIPADLLIFAVYPAEGESVQGGEEKRLYTAGVRLETQSPSQAKALASMFGMVRLFAADAGLPPAIAALLANVPAVDGAALILSTGVLEPEPIALLFNMFSVYSK